MILHLIDDEKVTNKIIGLFEEALPNRNFFICFPNDSYHTVKASDKIFIYHNDDNIPDLSLIDKVIIHYLHSKKAYFVDKFIDKKIPCYWCIWGGDLYNEITFFRGHDIYYDKSRFSLKQRLSFVLNSCGLYHTYVPILDFIKRRISYFITSSFEFEIAKKYIGKYINGTLIDCDLSYYSIDELLGPFLVNKKVSGNIILVGNSASYSNNHLYVLKYLSNINIRNKTIVSPLSYGGDKRNTDKIISEGKKIFGNSFIALKDFLPLERYNNLMLQAEICVYGNWRQEAYGNILIALYLGAKVYISQRSPLVALFNRMGLRFFILEKINQNDFLSPLDISKRQKNREIIMGLFSKMNQLKIIRKYWG